MNKYLSELWTRKNFNAVKELCSIPPFWHRYLTPLQNENKELFNFHFYNKHHGFNDPQRFQRYIHALEYVIVVHPRVAQAFQQVQLLSMAK